MLIRIAGIAFVTAALNVVGPTISLASGEEWKGPVSWSPPSAGVVPDAETAVRIAEAVLSAKSSEARNELRRDQPWSAKAVANAWEVRGTLPTNAIGGTYVVVIARSDARVLSIYHEQ